MKNIEQIKEIISNYDKLIELAKNKISIMEDIDDKYNTARGIETINFYGENDVSVSCDDSCMGCYDTLGFSFPLSYLALSDDELKEVVLKAKQEREKAELIKEEQQKEKEKQEKEKRELALYNSLKQKFGTNN